MSLATSATACADPSGTRRIADGDTIWISESKIRLHGIDALEARQQCRQGDGAATAADKLPQTPYAPSQAHNQSVVMVIRLTDIND